jgi:hypothetical protein
MKKINIDIFKLSLIILLIWICYSLHNFSKNGRFQLHNSNYNIVIDTRTGRTYSISRGENQSIE